MKLIPVTNNTEAPIYLGSRMLLPGDTRHFPEAEVPAHLRLPEGHVSCTGLEAVQPVDDEAAPGGPARTPEPEPADPLQAILAGSPEEIAERLQAIDDTAVIGQLEDIELAKDDACRREVLGLLADRQFAIADARHRAEEAAAGGGAGEKAEGAAAGEAGGQPPGPDDAATGEPQPPAA